MTQQEQEQFTKIFLENTKKAVDYSRFAQYFMTISDNMDELEKEIEELNENDADIPRSLAKEAFRHGLILDILTDAGAKVYNKTAEQLYLDGWNFWHKGE